MRFLAAAGLVMILAGLGAYYATQQELSAFSIVNLGVGPLLLLIAGAVEARRMRGFSGRGSRVVVLRWSATLALAFAAAAALNGLGRGWGATLDLTAERSYTLAEQTRRVCESIAARGDGVLPALLFFRDARLWKETAPLERAYRDVCPQLDIRQLVARDAPPEATRLLARYEATVLACLPDRCEPIGFPSEENITNALLRMGRRQERRAYFLLGHGEANVGDRGDDGFSGLVDVLAAEGVRLRGWVGPAGEQVPYDADLLLIASPERDLLEPELDGIERYLTAGGRLLVLLEPGENTNLIGLLERWGFALPDGVVVDAANSPLLDEPRPVSLIVNGFSPLHPVTRSLSARTMLLLPTARPVFARHKPEPHDQLQDLVFSSPNAWLERDVAAAIANRRVQPDPDELQGQAIPLAAAGRYPRAGGDARIVVIGDRDFTSNRLLGALYDRDLVMNAVLWLAEDDELIALRPKIWTPDHYPVALQETLTYFYFLAFALPEGLLLLGIAAWYRQRS